MTNLELLTKAGYDPKTLLPRFKGPGWLKKILEECKDDTLGTLVYNGFKYDYYITLGDEILYIDETNIERNRRTRAFHVYRTNGVIDATSIEVSHVYNYEANTPIGEGDIPMRAINVVH